ncbi:hypothetical protein HOLleu_02789 [Holothuria leucospilota]|uniref:Uncharacterized protein n=1 Tax=Holothuria leucospilota TaxID=206669 RepID=A0A9Q1CSW9_HOLLE|nr:hypothetical protein HOLleu_02789 [Holothuria leucospilota]
MKCTETNALYIVWKQMMPNSEFENVAYATFSTDLVSQMYSTDFHLEKDGSLTVLQMSDRHETLFCCVFGEGEYEDVTSYALNLYELPVPPFPIIDGCQSHLGCRIVAETGGNLTCSVKGVRPKVDLKWVVIGDSEVSTTFFKSHHLEAKKIGNKFDVIVTSQYQLKQSGLQTVTVECRCNGSEIEALMLVTTLELYFPDVKRSRTKVKGQNVDKEFRQATSSSSKGSDNQNETMVSGNNHKNLKYPDS